MFEFFKKNPIKKLKKEYEKINLQAVSAQRNGDIAKFAELSQKADEISKQLEQLESQNSK